MERVFVGELLFVCLLEKEVKINALHGKLYINPNQTRTSCSEMLTSNDKNLGLLPIEVLEFCGPLN